MIDYKAVPSGLDISRIIVYYLEKLTPRSYDPIERPRAIRKLNDILQVRASRTPENLLAELEQYGNGPLLSVCGNIRAFLQQRNLDTKGAA